MVTKLSFLQLQREEALQLLAVPFVHEGVIRARCSVTDAPKPLEVARKEGSGQLTRLPGSQDHP